MGIFSWFRKFFALDDVLRSVDETGKPAQGIVLNHEEPPAGYRCLFRRVHIAGISYRSAAGHAFVIGTDQRIILEPEPLNEADSNAIKTIGTWKDSFGGHRSQHLGYVPRDKALKLATMYSGVPLLAYPVALFKPLSFTSTPGVRFDIFGKVPKPPRKPRKKKEVAPPRI